MKTYIEITPDEQNNNDVTDFLKHHWGSNSMVTRGKFTDASKISRVLIKDDKRTIIGLITFLIDKNDNSCELISVDAVKQGKGIGTKLINLVEKIAKENKVKKVWLISTNDNYEAAIFYIKKGYRLIKVHKDALDVSRKLKPQIPLIGKYGIPLQDEWEFEKIL